MYDVIDDLSLQAKNDETAEVDEEKDELASDISEQPKQLDVGDVLPNITLKNEKDEDVNVQDLAKDSGVVIFLVPKADTREFNILPKHLVHPETQHQSPILPFLADPEPLFLPLGASRFPCHCIVLLLVPIRSEHVTNDASLQLVALHKHAGSATSTQTLRLPITRCIVLVRTRPLRKASGKSR